ncbi:NAD-binding protein [Lentzea sp. DG1S-22]|uniref:NAD-binding protein n=1 Tax=Lentzea sp. DG1S-22 TaxID=3108822 RepID=UPI002E77B60A|nr:NAD-binding protein [Lentzea sp. DG1S-22]WVH82969.1 NAD-binding protein [Lentzea sp. DG1S-22]
MSSHTVLIGFGERGRRVVSAMFGPQLQSLVVIDPDLACAGHISQRGARPVIGNGTDVVALREADVPHAARVIIAVADDAVALRVLCAVRWLNDQAIVAVAFEDPQWRELGLYLGADHVVLDEAPPEAFTRDQGDLVLVERAVHPSEVGSILSECAPGILAAVRGNDHRWRDQPLPHVLCAEDRLLELRTEHA